jgi:Na+/melibiose symporter-like transporter
MGMSMVFMVGGCIFAPWFCAKLGKKWATVGGNLAAAIAGVAFYFTGYGMVSMFVFSAIIIFGTSMANISLMSMLLDTVEYGEWKTGQRSAGVIFAANTFRAKLSGAIGGAIGAYGLAAIKYVPNVVQTPETVQGMHLLFTIVPGSLSLLATIPYFFYSLSEKKYATVLEEVVARRNAEE